MGITLKQIYEQREMLRRGEEISRAAKQAEERERLRDTFAAAALAGLLAQGDDGSFSEESYARGAYRWADAMLRERAKHIADAGKMVGTSGQTLKSTGVADACATAAAASMGCDVLVYANHDAAPAATAGTPGTGDTPVTNPLPKEKLAEVSGGSYRKADENRGNFDTCWAEVDRLREAIRRLADQDATLSVVGGNVTVTVDATLTPEERHAVETAALEADAHQHTHRAATLRGLLERLA